MLRKRDKEIIDDLKRFRVLTRDQIIALHFGHLRNPVANCNSVMLRLYRQGYVERSADFKQYVYFPTNGKVRKDSAKLRHFLAIVDVYIEMRRLGGLRRFTVEPKYGQGLAEPDAFCIWRGSPFFVEVQRSEYTTKQIAEKVARYESLYHSRIIESEPWQPKGRTVFPAVLMITEKRYPIESKAVRFVQVAELGELFEKETKTPTKLQKTKGVQIKLA